MTIPSSHPIPCTPCLSHCHCTGETQGMDLKPATGLAPRYQQPFRDDFGATAKAFRKFNSFRRLFGFKQVQWNDILGELAVQRAREFTRSKKTRMPFTVSGSKFNLGVPFVDIVVFIAAEHENGKMIPVEKSLWKAWSIRQSCAQFLLEPLANFAAVSVIKNDAMICFSVLISRLPPFFFLPLIQSRSKGEEEATSVEKWDKIMQDIHLISDSLEALGGDNSVDEDDKNDEDTEADGENGINENDGNITGIVTDEYGDDKLDETRRETKNEEQKSATIPLVPVIREVPLIRILDESVLPLPNFNQNSAQEASVQAIFEEYNTTANDRSS